MKRLSILLVTLTVVLCGISILAFFNQNDSKAETRELPSWAVYVHYQYGGSSEVPYATVYIKKNGSNMFGSPQTTDAHGFIYFGNGGSEFPDGTYEVRAQKFSYGDGVTNVIISGGVPVYPVTHVNLGYPE